MNQNNLLETLDELPVGIVLLNGTDIEWQNAVIRGGISRDDRHPEEIRAVFIELARTHASEPRSIPSTFFLGGENYFPGVHSSPEATVMLLMPEHDCATLFPELARLRQLCFDLEEIFRHSFDGIFVADGSGVTLMVNEGCERNYDLKAADMIGRHVSEFEQKGLIRPVIAQQVARTGQRISTTQRTHTGKTIMVTGIPLFDAVGKVRKVVINSRDTTELLQLQDALAQAKADLQRVDAEIEALRLQNLKVDGLVLHSEPMQRIASLAARVAKVDATVLITGHSGVGKDVIARLIHRESPRANGPLIKINCGALPRDLLESELFGYEPGAFTGAQKQGKSGLIELAHRGTLFLDEIGDLPLDLQVKLLQVLQDRVIVRLGGTQPISVDVRVIAATNRDLKSMVAERAFRDDLFYRLNVVPIAVPPLAARKDDIAPLVLQFASEFNARYGLTRTFSEQAIALMLAHDWLGNVRELRNVVERAIVTSEGDLIGPEFLDGVLPGELLDEEPSTFRQRVERFERRLIEDAMRKHGNTREVARALGLSQSSVVRKLRLGK
ncbi:PAS domain S-box protein [Trinickia violacea]|uniref:HTH-type transcriptional regulatory protein TyrR n=1 Tax=Trinickia violacea TaxID=2571746 RepID=A0A4P8IXC2_9BURK|nr:sigma 54-interacting transcriptional regulator [Trinickia violacea]QCP52153.1 PAS domain S-box protein [Trinickia violacea]